MTTTDRARPIQGQERLRLVEHMRLVEIGSSSRPKVTLQQATRDGREDVVREWLSRLPKNNKTKILNALDSDGYSAMHYAAKFNRFKIMQLLIAYEADAEMKTTDEKLTPLHFTARYIPIYRDEAALEEDQEAGESITETRLSSSRRMVHYLVNSCKVNVNCQDKYGVTPLHLACCRGNVAAVEVLLNDPNVVVNATDNNQDTPLHEACIAGDEIIVEKLLQKMRRERISLLLPNDEKQTPLHQACSEGHSEIVNLILKYGFQERPELVSAQDNEYNTPLHLACESGKEQIVKTLLMNGADMHQVKNDEMTALHITARYGFKNVVKILLEAEKDIIYDVDVYQRTALHFAAEYNQCEMIDYLLDKGADIEALDEDSRTPLLTAAAQGQLDAFQTLLGRGATIDVVDKDGRSAVFLAAKEEHIPILKVLIGNATGAKLCRTTDSHHNTPLHIAALNGKVSAMKVLMKADVQLNAKNEFNKTPIHLAAEQGHVPVVRLLLHHQNDVILDEDEDSNTPLHLACTHGHLGVAKVLVEADADVEPRNVVLWTPMDCAAARGHHKLIQLLIDAEAELDPQDKSKITPLHLACREGHLKVVEILLQKGADITKTDSLDNNALDLAIDNGHEDVAMVIIKSCKWASALRNVTPAPWGGDTTPIRKLIRKMPEVAEEVFNRCTETNDTKDSAIRPDSKDYKVTFNYEFLEDFRDPVITTAKHLTGAITTKWALNSRGYRHHKDTDGDKGNEGNELDKASGKQDEVDSVWKSEIRQAELEAAVAAGAGPAGVPGLLSNGFSTKWGPEGFQKKKHPLAIMVESERVDLLKHPLVTSLLRYKWRTYGRTSYFGNLFIYLIFLAFLTTFALVVPNPQACADKKAELNITLGEKLACSSLLSDNHTLFVYVASVVIIVFTAIRAAMEVFQMIRLRLIEYLLDWVNWLELTLFVLSIIFAWVFHTDCLCEKGWQWQIGIVAVFLAWLDLVIFIRKLPFVGIYVVMFFDICKIFVKMIILTILLVIAFGLAFYMAFFAPGVFRTPFASPARSILKTLTMTTGEFEFDGIFRTQPGGTEFDNSLEEIPFPPVTFILWILFIIMMPILLNNLLVGLAVDDIKGTLEKAALKRLTLRVELALSVEELLPTKLRRHFIIGGQEVWPNRALGLSESFHHRLFGSDRYDSAENISEALHPPLDPIEQVQHQTKLLAADVDHMKHSIAELTERSRALEVLITRMAKKQGITDDQDDDDCNLTEDVTCITSI